MSRQRLHPGQLGRVTRRTGTPVRDLAHEIMGTVAAFALNARVKFPLAGGVLMARAAITHARLDLRAGRMRVVAADARANLALLRMIRMLVGMAARARLIRAAANVVGRVAAGAFAMAGRMPRPEHGQIFMARPASHRLFLGELMRLVAANAGHVPALE
jgi:hypothetical protein